MGVLDKLYHGEIFPEENIKINIDNNLLDEKTQIFEKLQDILNDDILRTLEKGSVK